MSTIAEQLRAERSLANAPRVAGGPDYLAAVTLALAHARWCLSLPAVLPIVWVSRPGGHEGETWHWPDRVEVRLNAGSGMSPRRAAAVALHEFFHVSEGPHGAARDYWAAEDRANAFAAFVMKEWAPAFERLDGRPPSKAVRGERS